MVLAALSSATVSSIILISCHHAASAAETGNLVLALDTPTIEGVPEPRYYNGIGLSLRRLDRSETKFVTYAPLTFWSSDNGDFNEEGKFGAVTVLALSPGDWEIYSFRVMVASGSAWPKEEFSIPFTIKPGRTTYIGDFQPIGCFYKGSLLGFTLPGPVRLVITDKSARDLPIAAQKKPELGPVDAQVYDVDTLANPLLLGHAVTSEGPPLPRPDCPHIVP